MSTINGSICIEFTLDKDIYDDDFKQIKAKINELVHGQLEESLSEFLSEKKLEIVTMHPFIVEDLEHFE